MAEYDCVDDAAITASRSSWAPGDTVLLTPGNTYAPFTIPSMANGTPLVFKAKGLSFTSGSRLTELQAASLPQIITSVSNLDGPDFVGTGTVAFEGISFKATYVSNPGSRSLLCIGSINGNPTSVAQLPENCRIQWCVFDGNGTLYQRQAVTLKCNSVSIYDSIFRRIEKSGDEPKAILDVSSTGTIDVRNNYFDRCGISYFAHGGGHGLPSSTLPARLIFEQNYVYWPSDWATAAGIKNHIELKGWYYPRIAGNIFQNYWENAGQNNVLNFSDYSIYDGWTRRGKGIFVGFNKFLNCHGRIFSVQRYADNELSPGTYVNNGSGMAFIHNLCIVGRDPRNGNPPTNPLASLYTAGINFDRNTLLADQNVALYGCFYAETGTCPGVRITRNILPTGASSLGWFIASDAGANETGLNAVAGTGNWQCFGNFIGGNEFLANNPSGSTWLASNAALAAALDSTYRIKSDGAMAGQTVGANMDLVEAATNGVVEGTPGPRPRFDSKIGQI